MSRGWIGACALLLLASLGVEADDTKTTPIVAELAWVTGPPESYVGRTVPLRYDGGSAVAVRIPFGPDAELKIGHGSAVGAWGIVLDRDFDGTLLDEAPVDFQVDFAPLTGLASGKIDAWLHATERVYPPWAADAGLEDGVRVHLRMPLEDLASSLSVTPLLHRSGSVVLASRERLVVVHDGNGDLCFDDPAEDLVCVDLDGDLAIPLGSPPPERVLPGEPFRVRDAVYTMQVDAAGRLAFTPCEGDPPCRRLWASQDAPPSGVQNEGAEPRSLEDIQSAYEEGRRGWKRGRPIPSTFPALAGEAGRVGTPASFAFLESMFDTYDDETLRGSILAAMGDVRYRDQASQLLKITSRLKSSWLQSMAIPALHRMDAEDRGATYLQIARKAKQDKVFVAAVEHLAYLGTPEAQQALLGLWKVHAKDPRRSLELYQAVTRYGTGAPPAEMIERAARSGPSALRAQALLDARSLPYPQARDLACAVLRERKLDPKLRAPLVEVLGACGDAPAIEALLKLAADATHPERSRMADLVEVIRDPAAVDVVLRAFDAPCTATRWVVAQAAAGLRDERLGPVLTERIGKEKDAGVTAALMRAVGRQRVVAAVPALLKAVAERKDEEEVVETAIGAILKLAFFSEEGAQFLLEQAKSAPWEQRLRIVDAAARARTPLALPILLEALDDEHWTVRLVAVQGLARLRPPDAILPLIERLDAEERGRVRQALADALYRITGVHLYDVAERWRAWWAREGAAFRVPDEVPPLPDSDPDPTYGTFYGIPVESDHVVFVIDQSGSMDSAVQTTGPGGTEFERAVRETLDVVKKLPDGAMVDVVLFESDVHFWKSKLVVLDVATRANLEAFLHEKEPTGATNLYGGLAQAVQTPDVDTIYLLSDGCPTDGKYTADDDILRAIDDLNWFTRAVIHTVALGMDSPLLRNLAEQSGGTYVRR